MSAPSAPLISTFFGSQSLSAQAPPNGRWLTRPCSSRLRDPGARYPNGGIAADDDQVIRASLSVASGSRDSWPSAQDTRPSSNHSDVAGRYEPDGYATRKTCRAARRTLAPCASFDRTGAAVDDSRRDVGGQPRCLRQHCDRADRPRRPRTQASSPILELRQRLELVHGRAGQHDLLARVIKLEDVERDRHQMTAEL